LSYQSFSVTLYVLPFPATRMQVPELLNIAQFLMVRGRSNCACPVGCAIHGIMKRSFPSTKRDENALHRGHHKARASYDMHE
jgi:hypothetical protein